MLPWRSSCLESLWGRRSEQTQYKTPEEADLRIINVLWLKGSGTVEVILDFLSQKHLLASSDLNLSSGSAEMQVPEVAFVDQASAGLWASIVEKKVNLSLTAPAHRNIGEN